MVDQRLTQQISTRVCEIYDWISQTQRQNPQKAGKCNACGQCCDFETYDHRLYVTTPELIYFSHLVTWAKPMTKGICPYLENGKCSVYDARFAGCRIFNCRGNFEFQNNLSESALDKFKKICLEFELDYLYQPLDKALNSIKSST